MAGMCPSGWMCNSASKTCKISQTSIFSRTHEWVVCLPRPAGQAVDQSDSNMEQCLHRQSAVLSRLCEYAYADSGWIGVSAPVSEQRAELLMSSEPCGLWSGLLPAPHNTRGDGLHCSNAARWLHIQRKNTHAAGNRVAVLSASQCRAVNSIW